MTGRVWKFGDDVNTDVLAPGTYIKLPPEELALHCLEAVAPGFATSVQPGDFVVGGKNFGTGSSLGAGLYRHTQLPPIVFIAFPYDLQLRQRMVGLTWGQPGVRTCVAVKTKSQLRQRITGLTWGNQVYGLLLR